MFAEEKPALQPLPIEPFRFYQHGARTVSLYGFVEVEAAYYSVPPGYIGQLVQTQWDGVVVHPEHRYRPASARTPAAGARPAPHRTKTPQANPARRGDICWARWPRIGDTCRRARRLACSHPAGEPALRRIQGVLSFARKYGAAARRACLRRCPGNRGRDFRFVRRYLEPRPSVTLRQVDPLIRELTQYRDFINFKTKEQRE